MKFKVYVKKRTVLEFMILKTLEYKHFRHRIFNTYFLSYLDMLPKTFSLQPLIIQPARLHY
jgi:hypothetical protein